KWNGKWTLGADTDGNFAVTLSNAKTGKVIYTFTEKNIDGGEFKWDAGLDGVSVTFSCKRTLRTYKFSKGLSLNTDLTLDIDPQWKQADYHVEMKMVGSDTNVKAPEVKTPEVKTPKVEVNTPSVTADESGVNVNF
ncbi:MAG: hypothetical protein II584_04280, partial [Treponema sp.]|nr:hypothetical protein [Treponema sp.]